MVWRDATGPMQDVRNAREKFQAELEQEILKVKGKVGRIVLTKPSGSDPQRMTDGAPHRVEFISCYVAWKGLHSIHGNARLVDC